MISYSNMWIYTVSIFKYFNDRMFIKTATVKKVLFSSICLSLYLIKAMSWSVEIENKLCIK